MKAHEAFVAAFAQFVRSGGHGAQKAAAEATGYDRAHLNRVLAGQRRAWLDFQERIAEHY